MSINSGNGVAVDRQEAIAWTNVDLTHWYVTSRQGV